jgi:hypothetical protein
MQWLTSTFGAEALGRHHGLNTDEAFDEVVAAQALPRRLVPEDVAATVAFLAADGAAVPTGQGPLQRWWARTALKAWPLMQRLAQHVAPYAILGCVDANTATASLSPCAANQLGER